MTANTFAADGTWDTGLNATPSVPRVLRYSGSLGGGTLTVRTKDEGVTSNIPSGRLSAATMDDDGNVMTQLAFISIGTIEVVLSGSTAPTAVVSVK